MITIIKIQFYRIFTPFDIHIIFLCLEKHLNVCCNKNTFGKNLCWFHMNAWIHVFVNVHVTVPVGWDETTWHSSENIFHPWVSLRSAWHVAGYNLALPYISRKDVQAKVKRSLFYLVADFITAKKTQPREIAWAFGLCLTQVKASFEPNPKQ